MTGRLIVVVGPSGVGKDSVMAGLAARHPRYFLAHRVITRSVEAGGEDFEGITRAEFDERVSNGAFVLHWAAHGLRYGIPHGVHQQCALGRDVLVNLSRSMLAAMMEKFPTARIIELTAAPEVLAQRLTQRGREKPEEITARLLRADHRIPSELNVTTIRNDGALADTIDAVHAALQPTSTAR